MTSIITVLFGAVHCFAWSFDFPSETERLLWRIASVLTTVSPIIWTVVYALFLMDFRKSSGRIFHTYTTLNNLSTTVIPFYLVGRMILLILAFIGLRSLPPAAYETVYWTTFIPHL